MTTDLDWSLYLGWTAGNRRDAEEFARQVAAENGLTRAALIVRPAPCGFDVWRRPTTDNLDGFDVEVPR
jgi:hypothetical protein